MPSQAEYISSLFAFLQASPSPFHAVANCSRLLRQHGFVRLDEQSQWDRSRPGAYYVIRNDSSLIACRIGEKKAAPLRLAGAHTDSPCLKIKPNPWIEAHGMTQLGVEVYGGALLAPWHDRDCSLAGRVIWRQPGSPLRQSLVDFKRPIAVIPSLAIHLRRDANEQGGVNKQNDLNPLIMVQHGRETKNFQDMIFHQLRRQGEQVSAKAALLEADVLLYDTQPPALVGLEEEFMCAARLDNLLSCHALIHALVAGGASGEDSLIILNDHEEVGSVSHAGAQGSFLRDFLERLFSPDELRQRLASSMFVSVDNAHALHPNFVAKHDPQHGPLLNQGVVIKHNANQRYATNALSASLFRLLCEQVEAPFQSFVMRNDMPCGSTIGPFSASSLGVLTVDVGVAQLAMHSIRELVGSQDGLRLRRVLQAFFAAPPSFFAPISQRLS